MNFMKKEKTPFDWKSVYERLSASQRAIAGEFSPTPQARQKILHERAQELARESAKIEREENLEILEFLLAHEKYGIESSSVREVHSLTDITPVPCTPAFVLGIIHVRGQILSVIDLKIFFELPQKGLTDLNKVIILHDEKMEFAILADAILGIQRISRHEIQPSLYALTGIRANYLYGITAERRIILNAAKILADEKLIVNEGDRE